MPLDLDPFLLEVLVCPVTRQTVSVGDDDLVRDLNVAIAAGKVLDAGGETVSQRLDGVLVRADGEVAYPVRGDIPVMLADRALRLPDA